MLEADLLIKWAWHLSDLPPMTYLHFSKDPEPKICNPKDVVLVAYAFALPYSIAGKAIDNELHVTGNESKFPSAATGAKNLRGLTDWVEKGGIIRPGDTIAVKAPTLHSQSHSGIFRHLIRTPNRSKSNLNLNFSNTIKC
jgi:hypothetical protein